MHGVTISQLTGSDSAPAKANEAAQKNAIGEAKDDVQLTAINAQTKGYEGAYVGSSISAGSSSEYVGKTVVKALYDKYGAGKTMGKATVSIEAAGSADASNFDAITGGTITIYTTDYELVGNVVLAGGTINWGDTEPNIPGVFLSSSSATLNPGGSIELTARLKNASEPITWSGETTNITLSSQTGKTVTVNVDAGASNGERTTITAISADGYSDTCTITVEIVPVEVVQFTAKPAENKMNKNQTTTLQIATTDNNGRSATPTSVTYSSTEESVATVEKIAGTTNATLTAVGAGSTTISVTVSNGNNPAVTAEFSLTVTAEPIPADTGTSYVKYYADVDGDGDVDGIIYADLLAQTKNSTNSGSGRLRKLVFAN